MRTRIRTYATAAAVVAAATAGLTLPASAAAPARTASDFNADGYADLAVGVPDGTVDGKAKAGYVNIVWGGPKGIGAHGSIRVSQATPEVPGTPETGDRFGASVALVDTSGDGVAELLVGAPARTSPAAARTPARSSRWAAPGAVRARAPSSSTAPPRPQRSAWRSPRPT
ncbi:MULTISPECIES: VCBS repeat-containing protein [unclassified Streptomyces]|uniref:FG-GAP repeat domain-containing protein n=1 Tax=unclassified Streptomyces TaxID=2593676 RepID=UPI00224FF6ED|nr:MULTISPECIES: VCBS repeat-containing protein [unclassified Streptomyces]MCX4989599.1 VCBS repeat-containing protein [Streptomyces sp. NBC_00568]MCX5005161.1 VCBS repeat-containing protein [Streptomyces sp. NBC_00638]